MITTSGFRRGFYHGLHIERKLKQKNTSGPRLSQFGVFAGAEIVKLVRQCSAGAALIACTIRMVTIWNAGFVSTNFNWRSYD
jgi:hypothetical protein